MTHAEKTGVERSQGPRKHLRGGCPAKLQSFEARFGLRTRPEEALNSLWETKGFNCPYGTMEGRLCPSSLPATVTMGSGLVNGQFLPKQGPEWGFAGRILSEWGLCGPKAGRPLAYSGGRAISSASRGRS